MVRNYKKKGTRSGEVDEKSMANAIKDVLENNMSIRKSAAKYDLKPLTLITRIMKIRKNAGTEHLVLNTSERSFQSKYATKQVFSLKEESILNKYITNCSKMHYGLTCIQVRKLAYEFAKANNMKFPSCWEVNKMARIDWLESY